jgi:hypothetical protein
VLRHLEPALEPEHLPEAEGSCTRVPPLYHPSIPLPGFYALAKDLPIDSGEIESAHRYIFQKRLKIAGAWRKAENLAKMVALRLLRANRGWQDYWSECGQKAA